MGRGDNMTHERAVELGKMGKGIPKSFSAEERKKRSERMKAINAERRKGITDRRKEYE